MFPTLQTMLDAAASEAVVEPHDVAADGDMASVPPVGAPPSWPSWLLMIAVPDLCGNQDSGSVPIVRSPRGP